MAERIIDHTWYEFLPILGWIVDDAAEAGRTLDQAARDLEAAAQEACRIATTIASDAAVRRLLRDDVHSVHDLARDRVAALRSEDPVAAPAPVAAEPLRPNRGLLFNVDHGLELLLTSEPSEQAMRSFSLRRRRPATMAERIIDHTWYEFLPILGWIVDDAAEAGRTLDQAARDLEAAAQEACRIATTIASDAAVRRLLRDDVHSVHDLARDRVAALRSEDPVAAPAPVAAEPLRPNRGLLFNVDHGLELLLTSEPSEQAMRSFSLRDPRWMDHHVWYPGWLADMRKEVKHALRGLSRAQSELEHVYSDVADFLAVPTSSGRAATAAQACADAARHARRGAVNMGALVDVLQGLRDDILDEPPTGRVSHFFGSVSPPPPPPTDDAGHGAAAGDRDRSIACTPQVLISAHDN